MKYVGGNIQNTNFQCDSDEVKCSSKCECTASLDSLNHDILQQNEGIWQNTYYCFILGLTQNDS